MFVFNPMAPRLADVIGRESSDTESADHTTSDGRKKLSFPLVFKKKNDKVSSTTGKENKELEVIDDEDKIDTSLQRVDGETPDLAAQRTANDGEGVVYAELDLPARTPPGPRVARRDDDRTEYAEIIHSQQPSEKK